MFKWESRLLASVLFDESCRLPGLRFPASHEVCANARIWSPGDVTISPIYIIQSE